MEPIEEARRLGEKIRARREQIGLSQKTLAEQVGFSAHQIISQIETGQRELKVWELVRFADALHVAFADLVHTNMPTNPQPLVLWRNEPVENKPLREAEFLERCRRFAHVEMLAGRQPYKQFPAVRRDLAQLAWNEARDLGQDVWRQMGLGDRPAKSLVTALEEQYGIQVWYADLGRDGSAACVKGDFGQAILMNTTEAPWRRNFSFGHELFHLITWDSPNCSEPVVHKLANAFASSLLLPSDVVTPEFERRLTPRGISLADLITLAREFEVSTEALLWRLVNLRLLDHDVVERVLTNDDFRNVDRTSMASSWWSPPPLPERFVRLAFLAYNKGKLSKAVLADYLGASLIDLKTRLLEYGLDETADYDASVPVAA